jgi:sulfur relay (sulfurtransferase) DsrC/TusE family protein
MTLPVDLFHWALATFSVEEFEKYGINADYRFLIQHMADQEGSWSQII